MLNYGIVKNWDFPEITQQLTERDTILYALGIGLGSDPMDAGHLRYVYEDGLRAFPTIVSALGNPDGWWEDPRTGVDYRRRVHAEQRIEILGSLPVAGDITARNRVVSITDKGPERGALAVVERRLFRVGEHEPIAVSTQVVMLRGDGGYTTQGGESDPPPARLPSPPERAPDAEVELATLPQLALIYRLSGDANPLHAAPEFARRAGFQRPILHGLCSFGMAVWSVVSRYCEADAGRVRSAAVRFTAPVFPGDILRVALWGTGDNMVNFEASVPERAVPVLGNGVVTLR